jgi:hypothetical protein
MLFLTRWFGVTGSDAERSFAGEQFVFIISVLFTLIKSSNPLLLD